MPKRYEHLRVAASLLRAWIDAGKVEVIGKAGASLLQLVRPIYLTFPLVYGGASYKRRRMWVPAGSFLNSRWIPLGRRSAEWKLIATLGEQDLRENYLIVRIAVEGEEKWYRLIYEVVSSRSQLLRQRVHIRAQHARERVAKHALLQAIEREFAEHAVGKARLSKAQFAELSTLSRRLSQRIFGSLASVQAKLSGRDTVVFLDAWMEIEGLRGHRSRLDQLMDEVLVASRRKNFDAYLGNIAERLAVYISPEIRRPVCWARYHISQAALGVRNGDVASCRRHLLRGVAHLEVAIKALRTWDDSLPQEERQFVPQL